MNENNKITFELDENNKMIKQLYESLEFYKFFYKDISIDQITRIKDKNIEGVFNNGMTFKYDIKWHSFLVNNKGFNFFL